nr:hypothetical protein [Propionibacterium acidifaciens]
MKVAKIQVRWPIRVATSTESCPPRVAAVVTGMAMAPKPTLIALPTIVATAALILGTPRLTSSAQVMATGAPKPARPSMRPQKEKAMMSAWARWSPLPMTLKIALRSALRPEDSVRL